MTHILFVCTGNTCRSPMAEAIAKHYLQGHDVTFSSTGLEAVDGARPSEHAAQTLAQRGIALSAHRARRLTGAMLREATIVYAMTSHHLDLIRERFPTSAHGKIVLLDPAGNDVIDPYGEDLRAYARTATTLEAAIRTRAMQLKATGLVTRTAEVGNTTAA